MFAENGTAVSVDNPRMFSPSSGPNVTLGEVASSAPLRAVVYDDDASSRRAVSVLVERCGCQVVDATGGTGDIADRVQPLRPDLIVLELALAGVCGLNIIAELHAAVPTAAVVMLSPFGSLREAAIGAGAYELIADDLAELRRCVRRLVAEREATETPLPGPVVALTNAE